MHEMAITQSVVDMVLERTPGAQVASVQVQVGRLAGVVPDAMRFCFELATTGTSLEGAQLQIEETPGRASCRACGDEFDVADLVLLCPCGSADVRIVAGQELLVTSVRIVEQPCA